MTTGSGERAAAGAPGRGHIRASDADREQVIDTLKAAFAQGQLDKDEFDLRLGQTFAARTYAQLAVITADLLAGLTTAKPPRAAGLLSAHRRSSTRACPRDAPERPSTAIDRH